MKLLKSVLNYYKGYLNWCYKKENLKYSIPLILALFFVTYAPFLAQIISERCYMSDGRIRFKKKAKVNPFAEAIKESMKDAKHVNVNDLDSWDEEPINE